jgi:hypothetical protein
MNLGGLLWRELAERAQECAREHGLPHCLSYGQSPVVCFERDEDLRHGDFLPVTYRTMPRNPNWRRRLQRSICKVVSPAKTREWNLAGNWTPVPVSTLY